MLSFATVGPREQDLETCNRYALEPLATPLFQTLARQWDLAVFLFGSQFELKFY